VTRPPSFFHDEEGSVLPSAAIDEIGSSGIEIELQPRYRRLHDKAQDRPRIDASAVGLDIEGQLGGLEQDRLLLFRQWKAGLRGTGGELRLRPVHAPDDQTEGEQQDGENRPGLPIGFATFLLRRVRR
jgi:hypothetical protein